MKFLKKLFKRKNATTIPENTSTVTCIDFHDGTIRKQRVGMVNCLKQKDQLISICCAGN